ncbi:hypothetical protein [uncultured Stenotrophomonas sp.]|uniref:hypothetical protein n=1 Tax=uncultured Stenotrophomonas sp. TaxID=165438 RepID=UPI0025EC34B2|nr:hypothetical protein [uncultured Stenotrophomonas sp.]
MAGLLLAMLPGCNKDDAGTTNRAAATGTGERATATAQAAGDVVLPGDAARTPAAALAPVVAPVPPAAPVQRVAASNQDYLAGESRLLSGNALSMAEAETVLRSRAGFEAALQQFEQDAARHPDAQDLSTLYRAAATRALGGDVALASLSCGYSLCMGEIRSRSDTGFRDWVRAFGKDGDAPHYALITAEYALGKGQSVGRFVFSIDPAANGISQ